MASQGPLFPGTVTTEAVGAEIDNDWTDPGNVSADDGAEATITAASFDANDNSTRLKAQNFGFTIPAGATIDGVEVTVERRAFAGAAEDFRVQLFNAAGALTGDDKADTVTAWPGTAAAVTYGSSSDGWNASLTPAIVNDPDFGVAFSAFATAANTDIGVDYISITVHYTEAAGIAGDDSGDGGLLMLSVAGIVLAASLATTALAAQTGQQLANAHQDEVVAQPAFGDTTGNTPDLWARATNTPRLTLLYADDVIVAQPAQPALEHEVEWEPPFTVPAVVSIEVHQTQDERVDQPVPTFGDPLSVPPDLWARASTTPRIEQLHAPDEIVEQPAGPTIVEESDWQPPIVVESDAWAPVPWQYGYADGIGQAADAPGETLGDPTTSAPDLWAQGTNKPRIVQLHIDEVLPIQPAPFPGGDEGTWEPPVTGKRTVALTIYEAQDERVDQPAPLGIDDEPGTLHLETAESVVRIPVPWQFGASEGSVWGPIDEVYEVPLVRIRARAVLPPEPDTDAIVAQPEPLGFDEGVYVAPFTTPAVRSLRIEQWQDERVAQPNPLAFDEGTWEAPFSVPQTIRLDVQTTQDERVEPPLPLPFDEGTWEPPFSVGMALSLIVEMWQDEIGTPPVNPDEELKGRHHAGQYYEGRHHAGPYDQGRHHSGPYYRGRKT